MIEKIKDMLVNAAAAIVRGIAYLSILLLAILAACCLLGLPDILGYLIFR